MKQLSEAEQKQKSKLPGATVPAAFEGSRPRIDPGEQGQLREQMISAYRAKKPLLMEGIANPMSLKTLVKNT